MPKTKVVSKPRRKQFSAAERLRILREVEACQGSGEIGALLRREGIYLSYLTTWRKQKERGDLDGLSPQKGGPNIGALDAVDKLNVKLQFGKYKYVVEADIQGFFDNLDHPWLLKMLAERVDDKALLWLIEKWLKAGVLDTNGRTLHPETGTLQGVSSRPF